MYECDICGRKINKKIRMYGHTLCSKHMHQLHNYGKFLDNNPRTQNDLNNFRIENDIVIFDLYDQYQYKNNEFIIDIDDLEKIRYHKWRLSYGHVVTGNCTKNNPSTQLSRLILNCNDNSLVVDHINGNGLDNRKSNLRICTQGKNVLNKSYMSTNSTGIVGVQYEHKKDRKSNYITEIRYKGKKIYIGAYELLEEAVYARWLAEVIIFGPFRNTNEDAKRFNLINKIPQGRKIQISTYISKRIKEKMDKIDLITSV